jgi:uncharacterized protein (DUF433 family)
MAWYEPYITHIKGVQGGDAILAGTRTPVRTVVAFFESVYPGDLDGVAAALPHLTEDQIRAALAYYEAYPGEIQAEEARHRKALERLQKAS